MSPQPELPSVSSPGSPGDQTLASSARTPAFWLWRVLDRLMIKLKRFGRRIDWLPAIFLVVKRMRFPLLFAIASIFALRTEQGQEVVVNSFDGPLQGLVFVVFCALAAASVWYTSRLLLYTWNENTTPERSPRALRWARALRQWLPGALGASVMLIPAVGIWSVRERMPASLTIDPRWFSLILFVLCVLFVLALLERQKRLRRTGFSTDRTGLNYRQLDRMAGRFFAMMLAFNLLAIVAFATFPLLPIHLGMGSGVVVMLATGLAIVIGSLVSHVSDESELPILSGLFLAAIVFSFWNDNHQVTTIADRGDARLTDGDREALSAPLVNSFDGYLDTKLKPAIEARARQCEGQPREACDPRVPFVVVAAEGGGVRAAAWTALVLSKIDESAEAAYGKGAFPERLVAISGVSGGSLGGALYVASRSQGEGASWAITREFFRTDLLTPMLANMLFVDTPMRFLPVSIGNRWVHDRGATFERSIEYAWSQAVAGDEARDARLFSRPFDAMWRDDVRLPLLVANTTIVASGERMLQSPVILRQPAAQTKAAANIRATEASEAPLAQDIARDGRSFVGAFDANDCLLPRKSAETDFARLGMPLSAMVHNSARFTWVSPAGRYGGDSACKGVRVVDGGYFENSGTATADDIVWAIHEQYPGMVRTLLVQIRNEPVDEDAYRIDCDYLSAAKAGTRKGPRVAMSEVFDPLIALFAGRSARADQAKLAMKRRVCGKPIANRDSSAADSDEPPRDDAGIFVEFALLKDNDAGFPLHWAISEDTLSRMERQFDGDDRPNPKALRQLIEALSPGAAPMEAR